MKYPLSHQQKEAVRIMWLELKYHVGKIVDSFETEGYPVTEGQIARLILEDQRLLDTHAKKLLKMISQEAI